MTDEKPDEADLDRMAVGTRIAYRAAIYADGPTVTDHTTRVRVKGADGMWRLTISDEDASLALPAFSLAQVLRNPRNEIVQIDEPMPKADTRAADLFGTAALIRTLIIDADRTYDRMSATGAHESVLGGLKAKRELVIEAAVWLEDRAREVQKAEEDA